MKLASNNLCSSCTNRGCEFQSGIVRTECAFYMPPVTPQPKYEDIAKAFQIGLAFGFGEKHDEMDKVIDDIKRAITPQTKTGHWILTEHFQGGIKETWYECSECGWNNALLLPRNYCPNCGTKMIESEIRNESVEIQKEY